MNKLTFLLLAMALGAASCKKKVLDPADTIFFNGEILTMVGDRPGYAEAVAIRKGKITFVGAFAEAEKMQGDSTLVVDLQGKTMLPGFIDAHGHVSNTGFQSTVANLLPPPDGNGVDIGSLTSLLQDWQSNNQSFIDSVGWIIGFGYDDAQLTERRHPEATDLDNVSADLPVLVIHQSGHLGAMNTKALQLVGYLDKVADPKGGVIRRKKGALTPTGVVEEMALFLPLFDILKKIGDDLSNKMVLMGIEAYTRYGFTTAQEGRASRQNCEAFKNLAAQNLLAIDVVAYPDLQQEMGYMKANKDQFNYFHNFRFGGVKLSLDGSPQGKTAWLTQPYKVPPPGESKTYRGYAAIPDERQVFALVDSAFANNWQLLAHCTGDAAADQYLRAVRHAVTRYGNDDRRTVMVHAHTVRDDQLDSMQNLGIIPSFFGMHTFYWGDWHRDETLGKERAYRIAPALSAYNRGIVFTQHHDSPVAKPDAMRVLSAVVTRVSRSGDVIGPDQRISPYLGLLSITRWAAFQYFEDHLKGTIEPGKLADFVILSKNPLTVDPMDISTIKTLETIKEGKTVYSAPQ